jgi:hypothetical protein
MTLDKYTPVFLGLDLGQIHTRVSIFNTVDNKYRLLASEVERTSLGVHLSNGVAEAIKGLEHSAGYTLLERGKGLILPSNGINRGIDRLALLASFSQRPKTVLLGLTELGSLSAGRALLDSLFIDSVSSFNISDLIDESKMIESLIKSQPELILLTGGSDQGGKKPLERWIDTLRLFYELLPNAVKPEIVYGGNPALQSYARRRLDAVAKLHTIPNIYPEHGTFDLTPAQALLNQLVIKFWDEKVTGLSDLGKVAQALKSTRAFTVDRMVRSLYRMKTTSAGGISDVGVLALDFDSGNIIVSAGNNGKFGTVVQPAYPEPSEFYAEGLPDAVASWMREPAEFDEVNQILHNKAIHPGSLPETIAELAVNEAFTRIRLCQALRKFSNNFKWFGYNENQGLQPHYEPIFVSGSVLMHSMTPGQIMMAFLDALQPSGITTFVLDKNHVLGLLGLLAQEEPLLSVHLLNSPAFKNLGTVIAPISSEKYGKTILTIEVNSDTGKNFSVEIPQGSLRRLVIPEGTKAVLELTPSLKTDLGFGEVGQGGKLRVAGSLLGVVIDARGRPVVLPAEQGDRILKMNKWLENLGR